MRTLAALLLLTALAAGCGGTTSTPAPTPAPADAPKTPPKGGAAMN